MLAPALLAASLAALVPLALAVPAAQHPFTSSSFHASALPLSTKDDYSVLTHPFIPSHRVRTREPQGLCDPKVRQRSGYLDTAEGHHFYFWSFESRNDPANDPVILWLEGSWLELTRELGPCKIQQIGKDPAWNPYSSVVHYLLLKLSLLADSHVARSWTNNATLIFLDQPMGVGYSYADKGDNGVWTTEAAAKDVYAFLQIFFTAFADEFGNSNGMRHINLVSALIGNGFTNPKIQYASYYPTVCTNTTGYGPFVDEEHCAKMQKALPRCQALIQMCYGVYLSLTTRPLSRPRNELGAPKRLTFSASCFEPRTDNPSDSTICLAGNQYCEATQTEYYYETGRNPYDNQKFGDYVEEKQIAHWLNLDRVRHELGVDLEPHGGVKRFIGCSDQVGFRFSSTGDQSKPSYPHVAHMVDNGIATLFYSGKADFICNWHGNQAWTLALEWSNASSFRQEPLRPWYASEELAQVGNSSMQAGEYRQSGNLAFAIVDESGHFVPYDRPVESLAMFNRWIQQRKVGYYSKKDE
ncbi:SPOSA6832_03622, partial [Sporobolomyces salmonicolor]